MSLVALLSPHRHPRLRYVLRELSRDLGWKFRLYTDEDRWNSSDADARITYGCVPQQTRALRLPSHPFLSGGHPTSADLEVRVAEGIPTFFTVADAPDLLACIFYALSRYEEYQPFQPDKHHRFPARASHAYQHGYLQTPVVRLWALRLAKALRQQFPELLPPKHHPFILQPTYDIDLLWAYRYRGWKGAASGLRDLASGKADRSRERFLPGDEPDPYFNLEYLLSLHPSVKPFIFWLLADNERREDVNPFPVPAEQTEIMRALTERANHGLHPGYGSTQNQHKLKQEAGRYRKIFGRSPQHSRQHFLRLRFPATYRALRQAGITHDHSMGYGDDVGWRAGTNLPFKWYDLELEEMTGLTIHPFGVMDVTLKNYLKLSPDQAGAKLASLRREVEGLGGPLALLWHNSSFADLHGWAGWGEVYASLWNEELTTPTNTKPKQD